MKPVETTTVTTPRGFVIEKATCGIPKRKVFADLESDFYTADFIARARSEPGETFIYAPPDLGQLGHGKAVGVAERIKAGPRPMGRRRPMGSLDTQDRAEGDVGGLGGFRGEREPALPPSQSPAQVQSGHRTDQRPASRSA